MAEKAVVWYQPLTEYDEAAVAKHFKAGAEVALGKARELLAALPEWTAESVGVALHDAAAALESAWARLPSRCAWPSPAPRSVLTFPYRYLAGREQALNALMWPSPR